MQLPYLQGQQGSTHLLPCFAGLRLQILALKGQTMQPCIGIALLGVDTCCVIVGGGLAFVPPCQLDRQTARLAPLAEVCPVLSLLHVCQTPMSLYDALIANIASTFHPAPAFWSLCRSVPFCPFCNTLRDGLVFFCLPQHAPSS